MSNSTSQLEATIEGIQDRFRIQIQLLPTYFVGLEIDSSGPKLRLHQSRYIQRMAELLNFVPSSVSTPMEPGHKLEVSPVTNDDSEFRKYIGILLYINRYSRPDVSYAVNALSQHQGHVTPEIKTYAKRVFSYVLSSVDLALEYGADDDLTFRAFVDASYMPDAYTSLEKLQIFPQNLQDNSFPDAHSVSGYVMFHCGNPISWGTSKQKIVATSSTAAEIIAVCDHMDTFPPCAKRYLSIHIC